MTRSTVSVLLLLALYAVVVAMPGHSPAQDASISNDDATTAAVVDLLELSKTTTGTAAAGLGAAITFDIEDLGGTEEQGRIAVVMDDVTNGSEDATLTFSVNQAGTMTELMRVDGSSGYVGIGTTTPDELLDIATSSGDANFKLDAGGDAIVRLQTEEDARVIFREAGTNRLHIFRSQSGTYTAFSAYNGGIAGRFRMEDGTDNIEGDGVFSDSAFGPSEWVLGTADAGEVLCLTGSRVDADGKTRATVVRCDHVNCSRVVGVVVAGDSAAHHGRPDFEFLDSIAPDGRWEEIWRRDHLVMELSGFQSVKAVGPVRVGDTLVSAGRDGRAMASATPGPGAVIGTAMQALDATEGTVWTRVNLQTGSGYFQRLHSLELSKARLEARLQALEGALLELLAAEAPENRQSWQAQDGR